MENVILEKLYFEKDIKTLIEYILQNLNQEDNKILSIVNYFFSFYKLYIKSKTLFCYFHSKIELGHLRFLKFWLYYLFNKDFLPYPKRINKIIKILKQTAKNPKLLDETNKTKLVLLKQNKKYQKIIPTIIPITRGLFSFPASKIAEQLTLIQIELFSLLHFSDFISKSKKLKDIIQNANHISFWVASNILAQKSVHNQIKVIKFFLEISQFCEMMGNFNGIFNIMSGFQLGYVSRLRETWKLKTQSALIMNRFQTLTNPENNYKTYRDVLQKKGRKCLPYIGIFNRDVTFIRDGNPTFVKGKVNKNKLSLIVEFVDNFTNFKLILEKEKDPSLQIILCNLSHWNEQQLENRSREIKPYKNEETINPYADYSIDNASKSSDDSSSSELVELG